MVETRKDSTFKTESVAPQDSSLRRTPHEFCEDQALEAFGSVWNENRNSPLSAQPSSPLGEADHVEDYLETIIMDVERLFPGEEFFNASTPVALSQAEPH